MNATMEDLAYMAGVMDSDGHIGVTRSTYAMRVIGDASQAVYFARVQVKQTEPQAIDLFHATFKGHRYAAKPTAMRGKSLWVWQVHSAARRPILEALLPYLRIKRAQAENALEVCRLCALPKRFPVPTIIDGDPMVTVSEAAERLGTSAAVITQAIRKGSAPAIKRPKMGSNGPSVFVPESFLAAWATRGTHPKRSPEVTAQLEACYQRAKELNRVGI